MTTLRDAIFCMKTHMIYIDVCSNTILSSEVFRGHWRSKNSNQGHALTTRARVDFFHVYPYDPWKYIWLCDIDLRGN